MISDCSSSRSSSSSNSISSTNTEDCSYLGGSDSGDGVIRSNSNHFSCQRILMLSLV